MPTERSSIRLKSEVGEIDGDKHHRYQLQDALPPKILPASDMKEDVKDASYMLDGKTNGHSERTNQDPTAVPRSRSFFQHDDRRSAARDGRHSGRRLTSERGWWKDLNDAEGAARKTTPSDYKERAEKSRAKERGWWKDSNDADGAARKTTTSDYKERAEKSRAQGGADNMWRHDRFSEVGTDSHPPKRRRPFREEKLPLEAENAKDAVHEPSKDARPPSTAVETGKWDGRSRDRRPLERNEHDRAYARERSFLNRGRVDNAGFPSRDRTNGFDNGRRYKGRETFSGRQGYRSNGAQVEKWNHDLYDEANRSPTPKKEEDPVAKVEALLSL